MGEYPAFFRRPGQTEAMQDKPIFDTAIPQRRYQLGAYTVVVLGEIQSRDGKDYRYVAAVVREGDPEPGLYLTAERVAGKRAADAAYDMRVIMRDGNQVIGNSSRWSGVEEFSTDALGLIARILDLQDEQPYQLM
jgi:hypothetical protein